MTIDITRREYVREFQEESFFHDHIDKRLDHLAEIPAELLGSTLRTTLGVGGTACAILTGGMHSGSLQFAMTALSGSRQLVAGPYRSLLQAINPNAFSDTITRRKKDTIREKGDGLVAACVFKFFEKKIFPSDVEPTTIPGKIKAHITLRLSFALLAISTVIARVVDGIVGIIAATFSVLTSTLSVLTCGTIQCRSLNRLAYRGLQAPALIGDLCFYTVKMINPWAGTSTVQRDSDSSDSDSDIGSDSDDEPYYPQSETNNRNRAPTFDP